MKTITISTENSETYSSISNFFIDFYMTDANGEFVKVYLYLVRLLNKNSNISIADIADHFNLTEKDICRAIKYWISKDVIKLNYDGKGHLNGIVLLPLHNPGSEIMVHDTDMMSILMEDIPVNSSNESVATTEDMMKKPHYTKAKSNHKISIISSRAFSSEDYPADKVELTAPQKPVFSKELLDSKTNDDDWADIVYQVETLFGKQISSRDTETLLYIYDSLKFNIDLFEYLIEYCATMGKKNCRYMEAVAIAWYKDGIRTREDAKEQSLITNSIARTIFKTLGIRYHTLTNVELGFINTWNKDFGFPEEIIKKACEKAIINNAPNFSYINGILDNWNKNGIRTLTDIENMDKLYAAKKQNALKSANIDKTKNGFNNFPQTKLDDKLDEMEKLLLKEVNAK
ncbi:MAG: DnaD domain protein [Lachnospiraceae bacterium]|nr:DnaD domain protein [Lachnospiraceae bacterium]